MNGRPHCRLHVHRTDAGGVEPWVGDVVIADTYLSRFAGWQGHKLPAQPTALLLVPCSSIHTFWMRFSIDAVWLDNTGKVLEIHEHLRPWKTAWPKKKAFAVLELVAGQLHLNVGDRLTLTPVNDRELPNSVRRFAF